MNFDIVIARQRHESVISDLRRSVTVAGDLEHVGS